MSGVFSMERELLATCEGPEDENAIRVIVLGVAAQEGVRRPEHLYMKTKQLIGAVEEALECTREEQING